MERSLSKDTSPALCGDLQNAPVVFTAGRGVGSEENFRLLVVLAERFGAQVAGTRPAVDCGWIVHRRELGLSLFRIYPELYVGFGVSGTNFHKKCMRKAKTIIAVNEDPLARIYELSDIYLQEDVTEVLQALYAACPCRWTLETPPESADAALFLIDFFRHRASKSPCGRQGLGQSVL